METCKPCSFSAFQIGGGKDDETPSQIIEIPHLLSLLATGTWNGEVKGLSQVQHEYEHKYGPGNYVPNVFIQYWSMRVMAYLATLIVLFALWGAWLIHRDALDRSKWFLRLAPWAVITPFLMNTAGWVLTENGRQPWIVQGLMKTVQGVSVSVSKTDVIISLTVFVADVHRTRSRRRAAHVPLRAPGARRRRWRGYNPRGRRGSDAGAELLAAMLHTVWYVIIAFFWTSFFVLEGFDFGVGILHTIVGRTDIERRVAVNAIGPFWDGNEVWLVIAGASMFAAFPGWYATMFSSLYLALLVILAALMARGVSFEYRGKLADPRWGTVGRRH